jgi:microcystin-dependent protein
MEAFIGQIAIVPYNFAPRGWAFCNGQLLAISTNTALFSLLGTTYGGDGQTTFALPDLRGRAAIAFGQGLGLSPYTIGEILGAESVTLTQQQGPQHNHTVGATSSAATLSTVNNNVLADATVSSTAPPGTVFAPYRSGQPAALTSMANMVQNSGGQPHPNRQPYLVLNFVICLQGIFPSRN